MLKIRLSRTGRKNLPFYKIVLTEHTKPVKSGYKSILGWFNPHTKESDVNLEDVKVAMSLGAIPSERVAKILFSKTNDNIYQKYYTINETKKKKRNPDKYSK